MYAPIKSAVKSGVWLFLLVPRLSVAQGFTENKGQWPESFYFKSTGKASQLFVEKNALYFHIWDGTQRAAFMEAAHERKAYSGPDRLKHHAYRMKFTGADSRSFIETSGTSAHYYNYYLGNDTTRWKSEVREYEQILIKSLYPGIDLRLKKSGENLKYDFVVKPGADPKQIRWTYEGIPKVKETSGSLELTTSLGIVREMPPEVFQDINGSRKAIPCRYRVKKNEIGFEFPEGYDKTRELIIDPLLIFSTFTGATSDNWGFTATYDNEGDGYAGGITFGFGYPLSAGAFQTSIAGGGLDITVSKFNANGTALLFSTFLGGNGPEMPHSMVVDNQNNLIILGNSGSTDFPTTAGAYDPSFNGGPALSYWGGLANYSNGSDMALAKFNPGGTALLGGTYLGGTDNDGHNLGAGLKFNYADEFRGEVIVDNQGNILGTGTTASINFPTLNPFQPTYGGGTTDACVFRLNPDLTALQFSSYFGGNQNDAGYGIQTNSSGNVYFCGGTESANLPTTAGAVKPTYGGNVDGYLVRLNSSGNSLLACTYLGTPQYNQCHFVQIDDLDNVYATGQSIGGYPVQAGPTGTVFSNPGTGQFLHKMNQGLTATLMSTCFGANNAQGFNIVPSAFLVDVCNYIYISGWGGSVNTSGGNVSGMPLTPNAYQSTTNGSDFYLIVFKENAVALHYATYFGGTPPEHVDGGTSRFDKDGIVYQAICAGCGGNSQVPTTPGAYSQTNGSSNCNLALIKFDVSDFTAIIAPDVPPQVCVGEDVFFINESTGGTEFQWFFGDGTGAVTYDAEHTYNTPGTYTVMLIASQQAACIPSDTAFAEITVIPPPTAQTQTINLICPGDSANLSATGGTSYLWLPANGLPPEQNTSPTPTVFPSATTTYTVIVSDQCGSDTAQVTVPVVNFAIQVSPDDTICLGNSTLLTASGGITYQWTPATGLSNPDIANPIATPMVNTVYTVTVTGPQNCILQDSVRIQVDIFPATNAGPDVTICNGSSVQLQASGGSFFTWSPPLGLNNPNIPNPTASPADTISYIVTGTNSCGLDFDTVNVNVKTVITSAGPDTTLCPGESAVLFADGGVSYLWTPSAYLDDADAQFPVCTPEGTISYSVLITDSLGCTASDTVQIFLFPPQYPSAGPDLVVEFGESETLTATGGSGNYLWSPPTFLSCTFCPNPTVTPEQTQGYTLNLTDSNNCSFSDTVTVFVPGDIWVPNVFTPGDVNGLNDFFLSLGRDIARAELMIFNRWGELLFRSEDKNYGWDGTYRGKICPVGLYVWKINYQDLTGLEKTLMGHVTLLR
jgi:gliding motility-associated-like protein